MLIVGFFLAVFVKDTRKALIAFALTLIAFSAWQAVVIGDYRWRAGLSSDVLMVFAQKAFFGGVSGLVAFWVGRKLNHWLEKKKGTDVLSKAEH